MNTNNIPKVIHYCWFGKGEKPKLAQDCIASWQKFLPEYEIKEWNEDNFDINSNLYVKQAYENKKYAFVTDYVRLYALYTEGGVYMDTDVEVLKNLDKFLIHDAFSGFETEQDIPTGIMASIKNHVFIGECLEYYTDKTFINPNGELDLTTNVTTITRIALRYGFKRNNQLQEVNRMHFYPKDYFCPLDNNTGILVTTKNTHCIHHFSKSWTSKQTQTRSKITRIFHRYFGNDCFKWIKGKKND